jgi:hypothetical protein
MLYHEGMSQSDEIEYWQERIEYWQERALRAEAKLDHAVKVMAAAEAKLKRYADACNEVFGRID